MFDIGFVELLICGIIALVVLGPERLPTAARAAGRWIGGARRMVSQFSSELDRQLKAEELREELRKAGDVGLDDVDKTVRDALSEARKYENMILQNPQANKSGTAPANGSGQSKPDSTTPDKHPDSPGPAEQTGKPENLSSESSPDNRS